jgi:hypothetical protein
MESEVTIECKKSAADWRKGRRRIKNEFLQEVTEITEMNQKASFPLFSPVKRSFFALYYNRRNCSQAAIKLKTHRGDAEDSEKETLK